MADSPSVQHTATTATDRHASAERRDGAVVSDALLDAVNL